MRRDLTDALIRTLHAPEGARLEVWDGRCEGLVVRVSDRGRVTFHARARGPDGRKRFAALGTWPSLSLSQARTEARVTVGLMQKGGDPTADRRSAREERARQAEMPTLRELGQAWAKAHVRDTTLRYRTELLASISRNCGDRQHAQNMACGPDLMARQIDIVTTDDIAGVVQGARARGDGEARHLVRALRRLFRFAIAVGHIETSVVDQWLVREKGGRRSIPWLRDGIRERVLSDTELAKLWTASASLDAAGRVFMRLLLLTACRSGEITGLAWHEVERDVDDCGTERFTALVLPAAKTKNRRGHRVPLTTTAASELAVLAPSGQGQPPAAALVFPGIGSRTAGICRALRKGSGVRDWSWHDLRRTAATTMARIGCPREHVEAALNHISTRGGLTGIYQRYDYDQEAAQALTRWQVHVRSLVCNTCDLRLQAAGMVPIATAA